MNYEKYLREENQVIPEDMRAQIQMNGTATPLALPQVNRLLQEKNLQYEAGYVQLADGTYLVAMYCPMPGVTKEMIDWWFWWHPQENKRYKLWYPGEHYKNSYGKKDKSYFTESFNIRRWHIFISKPRMVCIWSVDFGLVQDVKIIC